MQSSGSTSSFQAILNRAAQGHEDARGELITAASERLLKLTRRMLRNYPHLRRWEQTDDVFQTAAIRLSRSLAEVRPETPQQFFGLAVTQIRRTLIDLARHHFGPEGHAAHHHSDGPGGQPAVERHADPLAEPENLQQWADFHEAVDSLPAEERDVISLHWYGGLPQQEIASMLDISVPTAQRRLYRARHLIKRHMRGQRPSSGEK